MRELRYRPLRPDEQEANSFACHAALFDPESAGKVARLHGEGKRCACVILTDKRGEFKNAYVFDEEETLRRFPFPAMRDAVLTYDPSDSICVIHVRGRDACVVITGAVG